jgi:hypothetical protein
MYWSKRIFRHIIPLAFVSVAVLIPASWAQKRPEPCTPPAHLSRALQARFAGWHIVTVNDLREDDQDLWEQSHAGECPGLAAGRYEPTPTENFAVALVRKRGHRLEELLAVFTEHVDGQYHGQVLSPPGPTTAASVVYEVPPGTYYAFADDSRSIYSAQDAIALETIEAGIVVYYWKAGRYHLIQTSD